MSPVRKREEIFFYWPDSQRDCLGRFFLQRLVLRVSTGVETLFISRRVSTASSSFFHWARVWRKKVQKKERKKRKFVPDRSAPMDKLICNRSRLAGKAISCRRELIRKPQTTTRYLDYMQFKTLRVSERERK